MEQQQIEIFPKTNTTTIIKRKRCPKGTRKHRKTGECVKVNALIENLMNEPLLVENVGIEVNEKVPEEKEEEENINVSKSVVLPPSQSTNTDVILDDVLASVPKNSNDYQRKKRED